MLKDIFNNIIKKDKKDIKDKLLSNSIMDGLVDIKAYRNINGEKKIVYHDTGDNVVTNWMRHVLMVMLTSSAFSKNGASVVSSAITTSAGSVANSAAFSAPGTATDDTIYHTDSKNLDGYVLNDNDYFWNSSELMEHYSKSTLSSNLYGYFPTKILFGTGCEYNDFDTFKTENSTTSTDYYNNIISMFGSESAAKTAFEYSSNMVCNNFGGTTTNGSMTGSANLLSGMRTFNNSQTTILTTSYSELCEAYNVTGAIKTCYFDSNEDSEKLMPSSSDSGKLLYPKYRGTGRPCFIYFNNEYDDSTVKEEWDETDNTSIQVCLSKDSDGEYLNRITFKIILPSQSSGVYYPYNGYTLNQVGLYNDAQLCDTPDGASDSSSYPYQNMQWGTLLAIKNITPFTKTASDTIEFTWTLTI